MTTKVVLQVERLAPRVDNPLSTSNQPATASPSSSSSSATSTSSTGRSNSSQTQSSSSSSSPSSSDTTLLASSSSSSFRDQDFAVALANATNSQPEATNSSSPSLSSSKQTTSSKENNLIATSGGGGGGGGGGSSSSSGGAGENRVNSSEYNYPKNSNNSQVKAKKFKMANDLDLVNDSGIPMDGVELDSSTVSRSANSPSNQIASTTNSHKESAPLFDVNTVANMINRTTSTANNEAVANASPASSWCEESKCSGNNSPDYIERGAANFLSLDEANNHNNQRQQFERNSSVNNQLSYIRKYGDLFDDDDLD